MIRKNLFRGMLFAGILSLCSCHSGKKESLAGGEAMDINVVVDDDLYQGIDSVLVLDKLVRLESEPLLASIDRLVFAGQRIFLTDGTSRLFCYDMDGKFLYKIDAVGNGPGEYTELSFFTVDTEKREIAVYDRRTATLLFYAMDQG